MNFLAKLGITTITGVAITLGGMTYFSGTDTLESAKSVITDYANKINIFESNENILVSKIIDLKAERDSIQSRLDELLSSGDADAELISQLEAELQSANEQIENLENQVSSANSNSEILAERIDELTIELEKANSEVAALQVVIDENQTAAEPLTEEEMNELIDEKEPELEEEEPTRLEYKIGDPSYEIFPRITFETAIGYPDQEIGRAS